MRVGILLFDEVGVVESQYQAHEVESKAVRVCIYEYRYVLLLGKRGEVGTTGHLFIASCGIFDEASLSSQGPSAIIHVSQHSFRFMELA